jgi:hypothetical protein
MVYLHHDPCCLHTMLPRQMKRANYTRCPQYMAANRDNDITELESLSADMRNIDCVE